MRTIHVILLSGGSGKRLWPLSNGTRSKQFLKVLRDENGNHISMVQRVYSQIKRVDADLDVTIATSTSQKDSIERQLDGEYSLVLEPEQRDTAPAIMLACSFLASERGVEDDDPVVVMPIDTFASQSYYDSIVDLAQAVTENVSDLVLLGVEPTLPSTKFGYIVPSSRAKRPWPVDSFREKPDGETAKELFSHGALWNCGVFAFRLGYVLNILSSYIDSDCSYNEVLGRYAELHRNSFDYEVVEGASSVSVIPYAGQWKDLGTWNTLSGEMADPYAGRIVVDNHTCKGVHAINETGLPMVIAGIEDAVVVATPDGILVSGKERSAQIKVLVSRASETRPMYERRRWGEYRVIDMSVYSDGQKSLTKELVLDAGAQLSYQRHRRRAEVWTVVSGEGEAVVDGEERSISQGSVVEIRPFQMHSVRATGELHIIEVQSGDLLEEEDIERFGYFWKEDVREATDVCPRDRGE